MNETMTMNNSDHKHSFSPMVQLLQNKGQQHINEVEVPTQGQN